MGVSVALDRRTVGVVRADGTSGPTVAEPLGCAACLRGRRSSTALDEKVKGWRAARRRSALPERVQRALAGRPVTVDGQTLATDTQLMLRLEKLAREPQAPSAARRRGPRVLLRQAHRDGRAATSRSAPSATCRSATVRGRLFVPTRRHGDRARCWSTSTAAAGCTATSTPTTRPAGSWPSGAACGCCRSTTGWRPSTPSPRRTTTRWRPTAGSSSTPPEIGARPRPARGRRRLGRRQPGRARRVWRPRARGCRWPSSCWSTPAPTRRRRRRAGGCSADGFYLTEAFMDRAKDCATSPTRADRADPAGQPAARRRARPAWPRRTS